MSGTNANPLLPANSALLQPGSWFFRLYNALWIIVNQIAQTQNLAAGQTTQGTTLTTMQTDLATVTTQTTNNSAAIATLQADVAALQGNVLSLQAQIDTINQRLANAAIP